MGFEVKYIQSTPQSDIRFSVCSLVRDPKRYALLLESFAKFGFTSSNSEFLAADNRESNQFDGYSLAAHMISECKGEYIVFCHEDIVLIDHGFDDLLAQLRNLDELDPDWLLAGIAGGAYYPENNRERQQVLRISDRYGHDRQAGTRPQRVETLDECMFIMKRKKPVLNSYDLSGFHFYGPDICLMADLMGGSCYVIDFHCRHDGKAKRGPEFRESRKNFVGKYKNFYPGRMLHCTTGLVGLGGS